jgi:hypothetical protein
MAKYTLVALDKRAKVITESVNELQCVGTALDYVGTVSNLVHALDVLTENGYRVIVEHGGYQWIHESVQGNTLVEGPWDAIKAGVGSAREVLNRGANKNVNLSNIKKGAQQFYQGAKDRYKEATKDPFDEALKQTPTGAGSVLQQERDAYGDEMAGKGYRKEQYEYDRPRTRYQGATAGAGRSFTGGGRETVGSSKATGERWVKDNLPEKASQPLEGEVLNVADMKANQQKRNGARDFEDFEEVQEYVPPAIAQRKAEPAALPAAQARALPPGTTGRAEKESRAGGQTLPGGEEAIAMQSGRKSGLTKGMLTQIRNMTPSEQRQIMQAITSMMSDR